MAHVIKPYFSSMSAWLISYLHNLCKYDNDKYIKLLCHIPKILILYNFDVHLASCIFSRYSVNSLTPAGIDALRVCRGSTTPHLHDRSIPYYQVRSQIFHICNICTLPPYQTKYFMIKNHKMQSI